MRRALKVDSSRRILGQLILAVLLGATAALFISGYWLIDHLPADSTLLIALSAVAGMVSAAGYFAAIRKISSTTHGRSGLEMLRAAIVGALLACFLFFAGTSQWQKPARYIGFLLPRHEFQLASTSAPPGTSILWITTSLGDVSYDTLSSTGWERQGDALLLRDASDNRLEWRGQIGDHIEVVFSSPNGGGDLLIRWNDKEELIRLGPGKTSYARSFDVPPLASPGFVIALGLLHFWLISATTLWIGWRGLAHRQLEAGDAALAGGPLIRAELPWVIALMALALLLRVFNLGAVFPAVDEYYHLIAADQLLDGTPLGSVYPRGLWIVTIPTALALRVLGHEVWAARMIGVLFNVAAMLPLYVLARRVSRPAAIVVGLLYATSPWIITFARVAREYAYYPLYFYLIVLAMIALVECVPRGFVVSEHWRGLVRPRPVLLAVLLLTPPIFALRIDWLSTFRTILIAYLVLGAFLLGRFDWRARSNLPYLVAAALGVAAAGWYFYREQATKLLTVPNVNPVPLGYFFPNPTQQWYYERATLVVAAAVAVAIAGALWRRREGMVPSFFAALFAAYLAVFALFSKSFFHTRHLISTQFWYVPLLGFGLFWLWALMRRLIRARSKAIDAGLAVVIAVLVLNPQQILLPTMSNEPDMPISEDYLHDMTAVQEYMLGHVQEGDALVSTVYELYATWQGEPDFGERYRINSGTSLDEIAAIVQGEASGWIVIDDIRLEMSPLSERSLTNLPQMEYIGSFGDEHVWRWGQPLGRSSPGAL